MWGTQYSESKHFMLENLIILQVTSCLTCLDQRYSYNSISVIMNTIFNG